MLRVERLQVPGLAPVSFEVRDGEIVAIRGASGSGKTLLLRAIADLDPVEGLVFLNGAERNETSGPEWRRRVRFVAAESAWWGERVAEHFADLERAERTLSQLALPDDVLERSLDRLSTGERQRLGLIRALEGQPAVLLLDEPTASLDEESRALAEELIRYVALSGASIVMVTHDDGQAARLAERTFEISDGALRALEPQM